MIDTTADSIYAEILMLQGVENSIILLLEGEEDVRLLDSFIEEGSCRIIVTGGRAALLGAAELADEAMLRHVVALADTDHLNSSPDTRLELSNVVSTDLNDMDAELLYVEGLVDRIASTHCKANKIRKRLDGESLIKKIESMVEPITALGRHCLHLGGSMAIRDYPLRPVYQDSPDIVMDLDKFCHIGQARISSCSLTASDIKSWMLLNEWCSDELRKYHNGHHVVTAFHLILKKWGEYHGHERNLTNAARVAISFEELLVIPCISRLNRWFEQRSATIWKSKYQPSTGVA